MLSFLCRAGLPALVALILAVSPASADWRRVKTTDPHMTASEYEGRFVLRRYGKVGDSDTTCPSSGNMMGQSVETLGPDGRKPIFLHAVGVASGAPEALKRMIEDPAQCALLIKGRLFVGTHHGTNASITPRSVTPYP